MHATLARRLWCNVVSLGNSENTITKNKPIIAKLNKKLHPIINKNKTPILLNRSLYQNFKWLLSALPKLTMTHLKNTTELLNKSMSTGFYLHVYIWVVLPIKRLHCHILPYTFVILCNYPVDLSPNWQVKRKIILDTMLSKWGHECVKEKTVKAKLKNDERTAIYLKQVISKSKILTLKTQKHLQKKIKQKANIHSYRSCFLKCLSSSFFVNLKYKHVKFFPSNWRTDWWN